ncbi:GGDEF domain-containing protein [Deinococcus budaensis]|uniref:Diguanylate cyclase (GGDEF)-like protein n=1 Tax=Deinococcus budaensis TaxID=1665626 RepID=A0A7W8GI70_9DEIO|nr:GGDEF domain-containing protein [Deinococcus budaensis]MBB5236087.1 diguanylate cyclase (GGDEF)-like protein [Deinococcus budaensis]
MAWRVSPAAQATPEFQFRRHSLLVILACVMLASGLTLGVSSEWMFTARDQGVLGFIAVKNVALFVWLWRRPGALRLVGLTELLLEGTGGVLSLGETLLVERAASGLGGYAYWLVLNYFVAALVFSPRTALGVSLGWFAALLGLGGAYWLSAATPAALRAQWGNDLLQLYLTHATFIAFLTLQGGLLRRYLQAMVQAERAARAALVDDLTGLPNRRQLDLWLQAQQARAGQTGDLWSVILFDLDHFKRVNDTFGHAAGDRVLRAAAQAAGGVLEEGDRLGRWGGEEFLVIVPGQGRAGAERLARDLQAAVAAQPHGEVGQVTVSCGVAQSQPGERYPELLERADAALYTAKRAGRALVVVAS